MKFIPLFKVRDMRAAIRHYTEVLDFVMTWPDDTPDLPVVDQFGPDIRLHHSPVKN